MNAEDIATTPGQRRGLFTLIGGSVGLVSLLVACSVLPGSDDSTGAGVPHIPSHESGAPDPSNGPTPDVDPGANEDPGPSPDTEYTPLPVPYIPGGESDDVYVLPGEDAPLVPIIEDPGPDENGPGSPPPGATPITDPAPTPDPTPVPLPDTTPPTCPENIRVVDTTWGPDVFRWVATIRWDASSDNVGVAGYTILLDGDVIGYSNDTEFLIQGLRPLSEYEVTVLAYDAAGNVSSPCEPATITAEQLPDILPPSTPGDLTCIDDESTYTTIAVEWHASTDNVKVSHYEVAVDDVVVAETNKTTYTATSLNPGTDYAVKVWAVDSSGNKSLLPASTTCSTLVDDEPPTQPLNVTVVHTTATTVTLEWDESEDNVAVAEYVIYLDGEVAGLTTETTFTVEGLTNETAYEVVILAVDTSGNESEPSEPVTATTDVEDTTPPSSPTDVEVVGVTDTTVDITWSESSDDQSLTEDITYTVSLDDTEVGSVTGETGYTVEGLDQGSTYAVTVTATDQAGNESEPSDPVDATTATTDEEASTEPEDVEGDAVSVPAADG